MLSMLIAGACGDGNRTGDVWKAFEQLCGEKPLRNALSSSGYEIRVYDGDKCTVYESENSAMHEWLRTNDEGYSEKLINENAHYCVEFYDERFNGDDTDSIVEIWIPIEKI